jgi:hypothetical protein
MMGVHEIQPGRTYTGEGGDHRTVLRRADSPLYPNQSHVVYSLGSGTENQRQLQLDKFAAWAEREVA